MLIVSNEQRSGSQGATTYARNRYGQYARQRVVPTNPQTARQNAVRNVFASLANAWNQILTTAQRAGWNAYAAQVPMVNRLGQQIYVTGINHYIRSNSLILQAGLARVDIAPSLLLKGETDPAFTVSISEATALVSVAFNNTLDWAGEVGGALHVCMGQPAMTSINYFGGPYKYTGKIAGAVVPPTSPVTMPAPFPVAEGQKVWCQAHIIRADGRVSDPFRDDCVIGA